MENEKPKFEGEAVEIGGRTYIIPSLNLKQAKKLWPSIKTLNEAGVTVDTLTTMYEFAIPVITAALNRNYPELTEDDVSEMVDMKNFRQLILIVSGQSGLTPRPGAEPAAE